MTTYLTYSGESPRIETDEIVIANLVRKGWIITDPPVIEEVPVTPQPNYQGFYDALLVSPVYNAALQQVMTAATPGPAAALAVLISALQDALNGRPNPPALQSAIWLLLGQLTLPPEAAAELQGLLDAAHLADLYSLMPPT